MSNAQPGVQGLGLPSWGALPPFLPASPQKLLASRLEPGDARASAGKCRSRSQNSCPLNKSYGALTYEVLDPQSVELKGGSRSELNSSRVEGLGFVGSKTRG